MSSKNKSSSLRWAIDELSKQKEELSSKLSIAQKREDTSSLIEEVNAQKKALEKRRRRKSKYQSLHLEITEREIRDLNENKDSSLISYSPKQI